MKKLFLSAVVVAVIALFVYGGHHSTFTSEPIFTESANDAILASAFEKQASNIQVEGRGTVATVLPDDNDGSRHQRFVVRLGSGQTILITHNIDLAPRVSSLNEGDVIAFSGEYEWNPKGGVIHWTHRDPDHRHPAGWLRHHGKTYQ